MLLAHEWSSFAIQRQPLRVSDPYANRKSTFWLQLPFQSGAPLLIISVCMHWLISQAIFLVRLQTRRTRFVSNAWITSSYQTYSGTTVRLWPPFPEHNFKSSGQSFKHDEIIYPNHTHPSSFFQNDLRVTRTARGYSPIATLCIMALGGFLVIGIIAFGVCRKLKSNMPVAASCSLAIAAACHPPVTDHDRAKAAVKWCEMEESTTEMPYYSFTSLKGRGATSEPLSYRIGVVSNG